MMFVIIKPQKMNKMFYSLSCSTYQRRKPLTSPYFISSLEVTATNKVVKHFQSIRLSTFSLFSFFLLIQVTLKAVFSVAKATNPLHSCQVSTRNSPLIIYGVYYKLNIYHKVLLKLNKI